MLTPEVLKQAIQAVREDNAEALRKLLASYPALRARINEPVDGFESPAILHVKSQAMLDVMLDAGVDINARSRWWAGGFGLLDCASPEVARHAIARGATITVHAAARLGMLNELKQLIELDPKLVHARGGDGQTPLHFATSIEIADYLLDQSADIDARDIDHESTPAQYMIRSRQEVARHLIARGCTTDILMAAALGDQMLAEKHVAADPECIRMRASDEYFPMIGGKTGGTIYQWELGWYVSACQVAKAFGHEALFLWLTDRCPDDEKLLNACWLHDEVMVRMLLALHPDLASRLNPAGRRQLAHAARSNDTAAARLMLAAGLPVDTFSQHHATPLHWAAWHGNAELVQLLVDSGAPLENSDNDYHATPLGWAMHGSENGWHKETGDYGGVVSALLRAGAERPAEPEGSAAVRASLGKPTSD